MLTAGRSTSSAGGTSPAAAAMATRPTPMLTRLAVLGLLATGLLATCLLLSFDQLGRRADQAYWGALLAWLAVAALVFGAVLVRRLRWRAAAARR